MGYTLYTRKPSKTKKKGSYLENQPHGIYGLRMVWFRGLGVQGLLGFRGFGALGLSGS